METQKNENNVVLEMKRLLGRMMVQVDYMYRNDREPSRLDLDIMMERTREFYELLCEAGTNDYSSAEDMVEEEVEDKMDKEEQPIEAIHVLPVDEKDFEEEDEEDWEDEDDEVFHIEPVVTEPEVTEPEVTEPEMTESVAAEPEDNSLAARLQRTPVTDIRMAMGINDKVMIINDLFMGSVERYNKSIDALNEFPTLSGAKVYMSELQIELQWDTDSQAYRMLNDLVERRFI